MSVASPLNVIDSMAPCKTNLHETRGGDVDDFLKQRTTSGPADVPVLVVDAGPTGLLFASELHRRGVGCRQTRLGQHSRLGEATSTPGRDAMRGPPARRCAVRRRSPPAR